MDLKNTERIGAKGRFRTTVRDQFQNIVEKSEWSCNQITDYLAEAVIKWLTGTNNTGYNPLLCPTYIELGSGTDAPAASDTALTIPVPATLIVCSVIQPLSGFSNIAQFIAQYYGSVSNDGDYSEAGLLDSDGNLFAHVLHDTTLTVGYSVTAEWQIELTV